MRAVWPKPSPAVLRLTRRRLSEVSRFSCMKFQACWGLRLRRTEPRLALSSRFMWPPHIQLRRHPDCIFSELNAQPTYPLFTLRCAPHGTAASPLDPVDLVLFPVPAHRTRTGGFPASGSRKRLTHAPTEDSRYGVVTGPNHTQNEETLPGTACIPAALHGVYRRATDAACGGHVDRPHCRLC